VLLKAGAPGGLIDKDVSQGKVPGVSKPRCKRKLAILLNWMFYNSWTRFVTQPLQNRYEDSAIDLFYQGKVKEMIGRVLDRDFVDLRKSASSLFCWYLVFVLHWQRLIALV
jgi:hypothetical protein